MLQEHKGEEAQIAALRRARGANYLLHAIDGHGPRQGRSCGVAIAVKPHLAYRPLAFDGQRGRVCGGVLRTAALGDVLLATVYAPDGGNLAPGSQADTCLSGLMDAIRMHCLPTIIGGDFNKSPAAVAQWLQQQGSALQVWATPGPTFRGGTGSTNIDFFLVTPDLPPILTPAEIRDAAAVKQHSPVGLTIRRGQGAAPVNTLVRHRVQPGVVTGPHWDFETGHPWDSLPARLPATRLGDWFEAAQLERADLFADDRQAGRLQFRKTTLFQAARSTAGPGAAYHHLQRVGTALQKCACDIRNGVEAAVTVLRHWPWKLGGNSGRRPAKQNHKPPSPGGGTTTEEQSPPTEAREHQPRPASSSGGVPRSGGAHATLTPRAARPVAASRRSAEALWSFAATLLLRGGIHHELAGVMAHTVDTLAQTARHEHTVARRQRWLAWQEENVTVNSAAAHALTRPPTVRPPAFDLLAELRELEADWGNIWCAGARGPGPESTHLHHFEPYHIPQRAPLTTDEVRVAAKRFQRVTATPTGWHPRDFGELSEAALTRLTSIFEDWETTGTPEGQVAALVVKLIPKPDGGRRPIGLYQEVFRVWSKARQPLVRAWQARFITDAVVHMQQGRQIGDAAWRARVRALDATDRGRTVIEAMWDLRKCFEHVPHDKLVEQASRLGFPMDILRVSVASYAWPRILTTDYGVVADALWPTRGIVAGSAYATFELTAYLVAALRAIQGEHPDASLSMFVDDLSMGVEADNDEAAVAAIKAVGATATRLIQDDLGLPFAPDKAVTLASSKAAQVAAHAALGLPPVARYTAQARRIGGDFTLQRRPAKRTQGVRFKAGRWRTRAWLRLRGRGKGRGPHLWYSGLFPAVSHQADLASFEGRRLRRLRADAARALQAPTGGACTATIWAVLPPSKDPAALLRFAPLRRLQREIWLATARDPPGDVIRLPQLTAIFERYNDVRATHTDARRRRQDPLSAAIYAATVVGWRFQNLTTLATQHGAVCLHTTSEAELRRLFLASWQRRQERLADAAWERRGGLPPGQRREPDGGDSATQRRAGQATPPSPPPSPG